MENNGSYERTKHELEPIVSNIPFFQVEERKNHENQTYKSF